MTVRELAERMAVLVARGLGDATVAIPDGDEDAPFGVWVDARCGTVRLDVTAEDLPDCPAVDFSR